MECTKCRREPAVEPRKYPNIRGFGAICINNARRDLRIRGLERTEELLLARLSGAVLPSPGAAAQLAGDPRPDAPAPGRRPRRPPARVEGLAQDAPRHARELLRLVVEHQLELDDEARVHAALLMLVAACKAVRTAPMRPRSLALEQAMQHVEQAIASWRLGDEVTRAAR